MAVSMCLGVAAIRRRDVMHHQNWMMRAYALALGAGTQVFTHVPWFLFPTMHSEFARSVAMGSGWLINLLVVEWLIARRRKL